jgi:transcriptional regulator with XRE-family HTH domain
MTPIRKIIGSRIKSHRKDMGISQAVLAEAIDCEVTTIGRYERGEYAPDGEQLVKIAQFFGISIMDLFPVKIDIKHQAVIETRAELIDMVYKINDLTQLERLISVAKEIPLPDRRVR